MALEDLTGTGKFISALNPAWPADDDWVDEGDNHIRGIKNVLKNTFPNLDGAVTVTDEALNSGLHADGTKAAPGIAFASSPGLGVYRVGATDMRAVAGDNEILALNVPAGYTKVEVKGSGYDLTAHNWSQTGLMVSSVAGRDPLIAMYNTNSSKGWAQSVNSANEWTLISNDKLGPAGWDGKCFVVMETGNCYGRSFNQMGALVRENVEPLGNALAGILGLRGVRYRDGETGSGAIALEFDDVEREFPELVSGSGGGKAVNYTALVAPLVEAMRELEARVKALEARVL